MLLMELLRRNRSGRCAETLIPECQSLLALTAESPRSMVQKALFKQGKKPTVKATAGAGKSFKAKQQAKKTKLGARTSGVGGLAVGRNATHSGTAGRARTVPAPGHPATAVGQHRLISGLRRPVV
jgi:hypothetical protein